MCTKYQNKSVKPPTLPIPSIYSSSPKKTGDNLDSRGDILLTLIAAAPFVSCGLLSSLVDPVSPCKVGRTGGAQKSLPHVQGAPFGDTVGVTFKCAISHSFLPWLS